MTKLRLRATCVACEAPFFPLRKGLCNACYKRARQAPKDTSTGASRFEAHARYWLIEAARYESEGFPGTAQTYREMAALAGARP